MQSTKDSQLDAEGLAQIKSSNSIHFDMSNGDLQKSSVGLAPSEMAPDITASDGNKFALSIKGSAGELQAQTDHIRFTTTDTMNNIPYLYYFLTAQNFDDYKALIQQGVSDYGIDADAAERWISAAESNPAQKSSFSLGTGDKLGFNVGYELQYDGGKNVQVITVTVSSTAP